MDKYIRYSQPTRALDNYGNPTGTDYMANEEEGKYDNNGNLNWVATGRSFGLDSSPVTNYYKEIGYNYSTNNNGNNYEINYNQNPTDYTSLQQSYQNSQSRTTNLMQGEQKEKRNFLSGSTNERGKEFYPGGRTNSTGYTINQTTGLKEYRGNVGNTSTLTGNKKRDKYINAGLMQQPGTNNITTNAVNYRNANDIVGKPPVDASPTELSQWNLAQAKKLFNSSMRRSEEVNKQNQLDKVNDMFSAGNFDKLQDNRWNWGNLSELQKLIDSGEMKWNQDFEWEKTEQERLGQRNRDEIADNRRATISQIGANRKTIDLLNKSIDKEEQREYSQKMEDWLRIRKKRLSDQKDSIMNYQIKQKEAKKNPLTETELRKRKEEAEFNAMVEGFMGQINPITGLPYTPIQARVETEKVIKSYSDSNDKAKALKNYQSFSAAMGSGNVNIGDVAAIFDTARVYSETNADAKKLISTMYGSKVAEEAQEAYNQSQGMDSDSIFAAKLSEKSDSILGGGGDKKGVALSQLFKDYVSEDPTGFLQEKLAHGVLASDSTSVSERAIADMVLKGVDSSRRNLQPRYTITKDRFGNMVAIDPITLQPGNIGYGGGGGGSRVVTGFEGQPIVDSSVSTMAIDIVEGNRTPSEVKSLVSPYKNEQVGKEVARIRGIQQEKGQKLSGEKLRALNKQITASADYKGLDIAAMTIETIAAFEKAYSKTGLELIGLDTSSAYRTAQMNMKEFFNLGVLNGQDLTVLESILPPPYMDGAGDFAKSFVTLGGSQWIRKQKVDNGLKTVKEMMRAQVSNQLRNLETMYGSYGDIPALVKVRNQAKLALKKLGGAAGAERINVSVNSSGQIGSIPLDEFDPNIYTKTE